MAAFSSRAPALSKEFRLLLLFSRLELDDAQARAAQLLCDEVGDWEAFRHMATHRFILPMAYRHLRRLQPPTLPAELLALMKQQVMLHYRHGLSGITSVGEIHQQLLAPLDIPYVTFKGPSLAVRYYDEPAMRFCRDIDILVPRERMPALLAHALAEGYRPLDPHELAADPVSLTFVARYQKVITLLSPRGVKVEFHSRIDNIGTVYDSRALIDEAEPIRVGNAEVAVLPTDELFVYVCWHHTKHFWSRLHWLVDLDAMQRHPSFDRQSVLACADRHGLSATVEICLKMAELLGSPDFDPDGHHDERLDELLKLSLEAMQGDLEVEYRLASQKPTPDFAFHWQTDSGHRLRWKLLGWLRIFRPSYADYLEWPLSSRWQWLYRPLRPLRECRRRWPQSRH
ncbi:nucleotidyltransferase family protein [Halomonas sp. LR5S13]|uniref:nucleotidyltransferase domain-containing protein n=1 Tax=Halomonas rhizosphaerae TaxID=3043296 RepID=UPI0024A94E32|nr:nucleotidyltransferase family protein [Halomonas rhizosphaerae]MDI5921843.1 nucleotidyltransferase family protein [Halomonas rhizosphaerae]